MLNPRVSPVHITPDSRPRRSEGRLCNTRAAATNGKDWMAWDLLWYGLAGLLILVGIAGTVLPALPGLPLAFGGMLLAAWVDDFNYIGPGMLLLLAFLTALALIVDFVASLLGAKRLGASKRAMLGAAGGTVVGIFFGIPGLLLGPFIGGLLGELSAGSTVRRSAHIGLGAWLGFVVGSVLKITLAFTMLGLFLLAIWI